jgi:hypothetical protein
MIKEGDKNNYIVGATTSGVTDTEKNKCGIAMAHAYSFLIAFQMTKNKGTANEISYDMILARNPWGKSSYTGPWNFDDN